jgi:hypothetical protein
MKVLSQRINRYFKNIFVCKIYLSYTIIVAKSKKELHINTMQAVLIYFKCA